MFVVLKSNRLAGVDEQRALFASTAMMALQLLATILATWIITQLATLRNVHHIFVYVCAFVRTCGRLFADERLHCVQTRCMSFPSDVALHLAEGWLVGLPKRETIILFIR